MGFLVIVTSNKQGGELLKSKKMQQVANSGEDRVVVCDEVGMDNRRSPHRCLPHGVSCEVGGSQSRAQDLKRDSIGTAVPRLASVPGVHQVTDCEEA